MDIGLLRRTSGPRFTINREVVLRQLAVTNTTLAALAREAKLDPSYLSTLVGGHRCPSARTRAKLLASPTLGPLSFKDLFTEVGSGGAL